MGVCGLVIGLALAPVTPTGVVLANGPQLALNPSSALPGNVIRISGNGFHASEIVTLYWNGTALPALMASTLGTFAYQVYLSQSAPAGTRQVVARGTTGDQATAIFTVSGPPQAPPTATFTPPQAPPTATFTPPQATATSVAPSPSPASGTTSNGCAITADQTAAEQYLFTLLNQHRVAAGVPLLTLNSALSVGARQHSCDMFEHQQLNHVGSDGSSPFQRIAAVGVTYRTAGENIGTASGYGVTGGVNTIDLQMMAEPLAPGTHHWNIVNPAYTQVGVGVIYANGQVWLTEDFTG